MNELVTVIITTHKRRPETLKRAIESVVNQTYKNIEILVVDDAPDYEFHNSIEDLVHSYKNDIHYIVNDLKTGACASRNIGIRRANGSFIALLDDDDEWCLDKLECMLPCFENETGMVYADYINVSLKKQIYVSHKVHHYSGYVFNELLTYGNFIGGCSVPIFQKCCIDTIGYFDENLESSQDYDFWLRIARNYKIKYIDKKVVIYYLSEDAVSSSLERKIASKRKILEKYKTDYEERPVARMNFENDLLYTFFACGEISEGWKRYKDNKSYVGMRTCLKLFSKGMIKFYLLKLHLQNR